MGSGKYLKYAQEKHGLENFTKEILFVYDNAEEMYAKESEIVTEEFLAEENTYNLKIGGQGGFDYINETKKNLYGNNGKPGYGGENLHKGRNRPRTDEENKKISETLKEGYRSGRLKPSFAGKKHSSIAKQLIGNKSSINQAGEKNSQWGTRWIHSHSEKKNKKLKKDEPLPCGWVEGRFNFK